jgi:hypothetical protein
MCLHVDLISDRRIQRFDTDTPIGHNSEVSESRIFAA